MKLTVLIGLLGMVASLPTAHAALIEYTYTVSSSNGVASGPTNTTDNVTGTVVVIGNPGDAFPNLDATSPATDYVVSYSFTLDGDVFGPFTWDNSDSIVLNGGMGFDNTLGAATLTPNSFFSAWTINNNHSPTFGTLDLYGKGVFFGGAGSPFAQWWDWQNPGLGLTGPSNGGPWTLTLQSQTLAPTPEPSSVALMLASMGLLAICGFRRRGPLERQAVQIVSDLRD
jgi:hypothetical protein